MKYKKLRTQILLIVMTLFVISMTLIQIYFYNDRTEAIYTASTDKLLMLTKTIRKFEKKRLKSFGIYYDYLMSQTPFITALKEGETDRLKAFMELFYTSLKKGNSDLLHMHIYDRNARTVYSDGYLAAEYHHLFSQQGNPVLNEAIKEKRRVSGFVVENEEGFYYSIIAPIYVNAEIIAYVEFGLKPDAIIRKAAISGRYLYALYYNNEQSETRQLGEAFTGNSPLFEKLKFDQEFIHNHANLNRLIEDEGNHYLLHQFDIEKPFQKNFGQMLLLSNVTESVHHLQRMMYTIFGVNVILLIIIFVMIYLFISRLIKRLLSDEKKLQEQNDQIHAVVDNSDNMIMLFEQDRLRLLNQPFRVFFNVSSIETFEATYGNIQSCFEKDEGLFSTAEENLEAWIAALEARDSKKRVVAIRHVKSEQLHYFNVKISKFENDQSNRLIVFSDITSLYEDAKTDHYNARHDALTGVYNRLYFNDLLSGEIAKALKAPEYSVTMLMLDIDHFKRVNDTYGHNRGDAVLKHFAQLVSSSIRGSDIFARWGGEEFILLLSGTKIDTAQKVAESLRIRIEEESFEEVGNITCSIGVSEYLMGDSATEWVARVDSALYSAKKAGRNRTEVI